MNASAKSQKPIIGLACSYEKNEKDDYVFVNHNYLEAVRHFGGIPVMIPPESSDEDIRYLVSICDGVILCGGDDIDPACYGEEPIMKLPLIPIRDSREKLICDLVTERDIPLLGICRGIQMMNVYFGGTLYQDIPTQVPDSEISHCMAPPRHRTGHTVTVDRTTPYGALCSSDEIGVNSHHHQAIRDLAPGFAVSARAADGIIEAIYKPDKPHVFAVQWHPENIWDIEESSARVFEHFFSYFK